MPKVNLRMQVLDESPLAICWQEEEKVLGVLKDEGSTRQGQIIVVEENGECLKENEANEEWIMNNSQRLTSLLAVRFQGFESKGFHLIKAIVEREK